MNKMTPQIRFQGFTDDWEERKLSDISNVTKLAGFEFTKYVRYQESGKIIALRGLNVKNGKLVLDEVKYIDDSDFSKLNRSKLYKNDILLTYVGTVGELAIVPEDNKYYLAPNVARIRLQDHVNSIFVCQMMNDSNFYNRIISPLIATSSQPALSMENVRKFQLLMPDYQEQEKIGSFFKQLDDTIALHQRMLDLLKEQKKGFLQKMFPKNGAKVPELRFSGFADDWEERKLSDIANHRGGTAIEKYFDKDGVYKVISIGSYGLNSQYVDQNIRAISNEITDGRVVNSGELTMVLNDKTANGTIIGRSLLVEKDNEYVINQRTEIISPKEKFDSNFAYTILNGPFREKVKRIVQGGTQIYVNYPAVSNLNLELPKIEEQRKISSFFKQLDDTIALHQRMLDLLKEQKKGFLQKMFIS
ncbi:restriction endonuclease subunit S [Leuconostoc mesenteroides]|uniref:restriction endonuclease subunit S n=1 Tax=Leuconostoc mesenteroides TaxID=1245 RepID=UPI00235E038C|nr:restriction endonuclease subunit S [Leuconostoc mesenteroides]